MSARRRLVFHLAVVPLLMAIAVSAVPVVARAQCLMQKEAGNWQNANSASQSLTRIQLRFTCQDQILNGEP